MARGNFMGDVIDQLICLVGRLTHSWLKLCACRFSFSVSRQHSMILMLCVLVPGYGIAASLPATEFVVPSGPVISLQDGQSIDGHITELDQDNVTIRLDDGTEQMIPRAAIDLINFKTVSGMDIIGPLIGWKPGVYELSTDDNVVTVYSMAPKGPTQAKKQEKEEVIDLVAQEETDEVNGTVVPSVIPDVAAATPNETAEEQPEETEVQVANTAPDDVDIASDGPIEIKISAENTIENGKPITFHIQLSRASKNSVVLIYATIDDTAINGEDYEAARGVLVIEAGDTEAWIEASVINDDISEEMEAVHLFLTVDPSVAVVKNRQIVATIEDDDGE